MTAENVAREFKVSREEQDEFAAASQKKAAAAMESGWFREEMTDVTVVGRRGSSVIIDKDEFVKPDTTRETLAKLRPAFVKKMMKFLAFSVICTINIFHFIT